MENKEVWKDYKYKTKTLEELDREYEQSVKREKKRKIFKIIIWIAIFIFLFPDAFLYWIRFASPHSPKYITNEIIDISREPVQIEINDKNKKFIEYQTLENKGTYVLEKMARYSISGKVVAKNYFFWGNYIPLGQRVFQSVALFDIGLVWGKMADDDVLKYYNFISAKDMMARALYPRLKHGVKNPPLSWNYASSKFSHTHIIPASSSIMYALIYAKNKQPIRMEGYLVDVYDKTQKIAMTSLSREDSNVTSRGYRQGGGACEIMYVKRLYVGNKVYE